MVVSPKKIVEEKYIPSLDLLLKNLPPTETSSRAELARSDALIIEYTEWMDGNMPNIMAKLNGDHNYKTR